MRTYLYCVRENRITWFGYLMLVSGLLIVWMNGWTFHQTPYLILVIIGIGIALVLWTAFSTIDACADVYKSLERRNGEIDSEFATFWENRGLPCLRAGYRAAKRKWKRKHPDCPLKISRT